MTPAAALLLAAAALAASAASLAAALVQRRVLAHQLAPGRNPMDHLTDCTGTGQRYTPTRVARCPDCARPRAAIGDPGPDGAIPSHSPSPADPRR